MGFAPERNRKFFYPKLKINVDLTRGAFFWQVKRRRIGGEREEYLSELFKDMYVYIQFDENLDFKNF